MGKSKITWQLTTDNPCSFFSDDGAIIIRASLAKLSPHVGDLIHEPESLHGLSHKLVAVESVIYLAKQFQMLKQFFESLSIDKTFMETYFNQVFSKINIDLDC